MPSGLELKIEKNTFFIYRFTWGRHVDPGVVESPRGAVLGARWPFLILAQRHRKGKPLLSTANRMLIMAKKNVMSTKINLFWVFRGHFGGPICNLVELEKIEKSLFPPMDFSGISRDLAEAREAIIPRKWENIFLVQNREISGAKVESWTRKECSSCLNSFLDEISATLALRLRLRLVGYHLYG